MKRSWLSTMAAAALALALVAGCSSDDGDDEAASTPDTAEVTTGDAGEDGGPDTSEGGPTKKPTVNDVRDSQGSVEGYEGAMEDATVEKCTTEEGQLQVGGTVTNPLEDVRQYRIYVSAMEGTETRGVVQVDVEPVEPQATAFWSASLAISDPGLSCLLRVERFEPL